MMEDLNCSQKTELTMAPRKSQLFYYKKETDQSSDNEYYDTTHFESHINSVIKTNKFDLNASPEPRHQLTLNMQSTRSSTDDSDSASNSPVRPEHLTATVSAFTL